MKASTKGKEKNFCRAGAWVEVRCGRRSGVWIRDGFIGGDVDLLSPDLHPCTHDAGGHAIPTWLPTEAA